jgi:hypothetical protein
VSGWFSGLFVRFREMVFVVLSADLAGLREFVGNLWEILRICVKLSNFNIMYYVDPSNTGGCRFS